MDMKRKLAAFLAAILSTTGLTTLLVASPAQAVTVYGPYEIVSEWTGGTPPALRCMDIESWSQANGARDQLYTCRPSGYVQSNQSFFLYSVDGSPNVYSIKPAHSAKCLDIKDYSSSLGAVVQQWDCTGATNQLFTLAWLDSSRFQIRPLTRPWPDSWCVKPLGQIGDGAVLIQGGCSVNADVQWRLNPV